MALAKIKSAASGEPAIGIDKTARKNVAQCLSHLLAESYILQLKTQYYHWNITGPFFASLHPLLGTQYDALAAAVDEIAERTRALGVFTTGTFREFAALASIKEDKMLPADWQSMIRNLVEAHELLIRSAREWLISVQKAGDEVTADLFIGRLHEHEKAAWVLRSHLQ